MDFALCSGLTVEQLSKASDLACWNNYACHHGERHGLTEAPISYRLRVMARCRENNLYQARCIGMHTAPAAFTAVLHRIITPLFDRTCRWRKTRQFATLCTQSDASSPGLCSLD